MLNKQYYVEKAKVDRLVARKNTKADFYLEQAPQATQPRISLFPICTISASRNR